MNRFITKETKYTEKKSKSGWLYLIIPMLIVLFWIILSTVDESTIARQKDSLESALNKDIIHCYAVEGFYPPSLSYIEEHYGLTYNHDIFFIDYQPIGSNIRPDVTVLVTE